MGWWLGLLGIVIGGVAAELPGALLGGTLGGLLGMIHALRARLLRLEQEVERLRPLAPDAAQPSAVEGTRPLAAPAVEAANSPVPAFIDLPAEVIEAVAAEPSPRPPAPTPQEEWPQQPGGAMFEGAWLERAREFLTGGNPVVRIGLVILFFGVGFLLKYAAERDLMPVELRYLATASGALGLLGLGWYQRQRRPSFALLLQGGGIGILYLTIFAALHLHALIPAPLAFALLVALTTASAALAILQDARGLAAFATAGGFLSPLLASTDSGNHVALFSYYALLNLGVLSIAWFRAWRELNLIGFLFTFVIASSWGYLSYEPALFASTEPFLLLFYLIYVTVSVLYASRQPPTLRGLIDGTLVFGLPVIGFALQAALVEPYEFGLAYSAFALSALYLLLSRWCRHQGMGLPLLSQVFLALGVVFATLALPLALSDRWSSAAWALEGAGLVFIGVQQGRRLPRWLGVALQLGAGIFYGIDPTVEIDPLPFLNGPFLGALLLALSGLISAYQLRPSNRLYPYEQPLAPLMLIWGLVWWGGAWIHEIDQFFHWKWLIAWWALSALLLLEVTRRLDWSMPRYALQATLPLLLLGPFPSLLAMGPPTHPFAGWGGIVWPLSLVTTTLFLWRAPPLLSRLALMWQHGLLALLVLLLLLVEVDWGISDWLAAGSGTWRQAVAVCITAATLLAIPYLSRRVRWPLGEFANAYLLALLLPAILLVGWIANATFQVGDPFPLPYFPLLNPLELAQLIGITALLLFTLPRPQLFGLTHRHPLLAGAGALALLALSGILARALHFWSGLPWRWDLMLRSVELQASWSVAWSLTALILMVLATRRSWRQVWFVGAALLGLVVVKLFLVDLASSNTVSRIVSFLAVGGLMLVIGFFSPLPPRREAQEG